MKIKEVIYCLKKERSTHGFEGPARHCQGLSLRQNVLVDSLISNLLVICSLTTGRGPLASAWQCVAGPRKSLRMTSSLLTCFTHHKSPPPLRGMQIIGGGVASFQGIALALHGELSSSSLMFGLKLHASAIPACFRSEISLRTSHKLLPLQWKAKKAFNNVRSRLRQSVRSTVPARS